MGSETAKAGEGPGLGRPDTVEALRKQLPEAVLDVIRYKGETTVLIEPGRIVEACRFLMEKPDLGFIMLVDLCATHWVDREYSYEVAYLLHSFLRNERIRLKVRLGEDGLVETMTELYAGADWNEREAYDLVGVVFEGHPDLRRILMPDDYDAYPLRKDFPVKGY